MAEERTVMMNLTEFEAGCIEAIRRIKQHQEDLMDWKGIIICSEEWHRELVRECIRWKRIAEELASDYVDAKTEQSER